MSGVPFSKAKILSIESSRQVRVAIRCREGARSRDFDSRARQDLHMSLHVTVIFLCVLEIIGLRTSTCPLIDGIIAGGSQGQVSEAMDADPRQGYN
jgi:hypothetical protein